MTHRDPEKKLSNIDYSNYTDIHVSLAKEIFSHSLERRKILESKSEKLIGIIALLIPFVVAIFTYVFSRLEYSLSVKLFSLFFSILLLVFLVVAFVAAFRSRQVSAITMPGIEFLIDIKNIQAKTVNQKSLTNSYLFFGLNNETSNDHIADFVKASEEYTIIAVFFLVFTLIPVSYGYFNHQEKKNMKQWGDASKELSSLTINIKSMEVKIDEIDNYLSQVKIKDKNFSKRIYLLEKRVVLIENKKTWSNNNSELNSKVNK